MPSNCAKLQSYIQDLSEFKLLTSAAVQYNHMGATITEAILQSGLRYETVVRPRVEHILHTYPEASTVSAFLMILQTHGPEEILQWKHADKPGGVLAVTQEIFSKVVF